MKKVVVINSSNWFFIKIVFVFRLYDRMFFPRMSFFFDRKYLNINSFVVHFLILDS